jgi:hypothetical protein
VAGVLDKSNVTDGLLFGNQHLLVKFVGDPECWAFRFVQSAVLQVGAGGGVLFHVSLHPVRELPLSAESESNAFGGAAFKAAV